MHMVIYPVVYDDNANRTRILLIDRAQGIVHGWLFTIVCDGHPHRARFVFANRAPCISYGF